MDPSRLCDVAEEEENTREEQAEHRVESVGAKLLRSIKVCCCYSLWCLSIMDPRFAPLAADTAMGNKVCRNGQ